MSVESVTPIKSHKFMVGMYSLPKDEYFVVDPCYVLGRDDQFWSEYCNFCFPNGNCEGMHREVWIEVNGKMCYTFSTCYGDGSYPVTYRGGTGEAGVDSGCLSFIPKSIVEEFHPDVKDQLYYGVSVGEVSGYPEYHNGDVTVDHVTVDTSGENDEGDLDW